MGFTLSVDFERPVGPVFAYLADPTHRPQWQASLRRVEVLTTGPPRVGTQWYDVTWPGLRPLMEITVWETDRRWVERGTWRGVEVLLDLAFTEIGDHTRVTATATTRAPGWRRPIALGLDLLGPLGARDDLRRAARLL